LSAGSDTRPLARRIADRCVAALVGTIFVLSRALGPDRASALGGFVARTIGPRLGLSKRAERNLVLALPELDGAARRRIVREVWDNLGRTAMEYPHIVYLAQHRTEYCGGDHIREALKRGKSIFFVSGHLANWEIAPAILKIHGLPLNIVYRAINNPHVDALIKRCRGEGAAAAIPKGFAGAQAMKRLLAARQHFGMLLDQKQNDGVPIPFFGRDAMTASAAAIFALRFDVEMLPAQVERLGGARFRATAFPPLTITPSGDRDEDVRALMVAFNAQLEGWIRANPGQWLWLHSRWPKS
jgi:KDO2-lipid IV(A) lauroyltransferase